MKQGALEVLSSDTPFPTLTQPISSQPNPTQPNLIDQQTILGLF